MAERELPAEFARRFKLRGKQVAFVREYLVDLNGTQAALRAGHSRRSAAAIASENLRKPNICAALAELAKPVLDRNEVTAERVVAELAAIAFANVADLKDVRNLEALPRELAAAVKEIKFVDLQSGDVGNASAEERRIVHVKLQPKLPALLKLGEYLGLFRPAGGVRTVARPGKKEQAEAAALAAPARGSGFEHLEDLEPE